MQILAHFSVSDATTGFGNTNGNANSSGTVGSNAAPNCSNEWSDAVQSQIFCLETQVGKLINTSEDAAWKINDIHNTANSQTELVFSNTKDIDKILNTTGNSAQKLINIVNTLSNIQDTCISTAGVADDILLIAQELLVLHNESAALPTSCQEIKQQRPNSPSGSYILAASDGTSSYNTYCDMGTLCGSGGGWTRLAYLDMTDATENCPSGFRLYQSGGVRACGRPATSSGGCVSVQFPSNGISYSQVCGRVTGYQYNSPDAVNLVYGSNHNNLSSDYVDGVSITRGSPRQHVWTLMAANC
uniref:Fibrinogen C-terminal domain-containing protein n=1 Tax=Amphimedon queenslandica TaxID=400682 RepID=A0A1X7T0E6_AMPQE